MRRTLVLLLAATAGAVLLLAGATVLRPAPQNAAPDPTGVAAPTSDLDRTQARLQERLRRLPKDHRGWAALGIGYVEQARVTGNPVFYPKAEGALANARGAAPDDPLAAAGLAALAAARHDFSAALVWADRSLAVDGYGEQALAVRVDALVELGRYREAMTAAVAADRVRPGLPAFTRLSYLHELHGDLAGARRLMAHAAEAARSPADRAFVHTHLGDLLRLSGDVPGSTREYAAALRAVPAYPGALAGQARLALRAGDSDKAAQLLETAVQRLPLPEFAVLLGDLYAALGRPAKAGAQYDLVRATAALARANGVRTALETALFDAEHGRADAALASAQAEWDRRRSIHAADVLAWALHATGADQEALEYARSATRLGTPDPLLLYHRGMIEFVLDHRTAARRSLAAALRLDPAFSPIHAPRARLALAALGGAP